MRFGTVSQNLVTYEEACNCSLTSVTDKLFVPSALPPETNTHSSKLQKEVKSAQKQPSCKKRCGPGKKRQHAQKLA